MLYNKKIALRRIALGLSINILAQLFFPTVSFALTSGPTSPEFSSFEPVDATDMVNLSTGDLTYTLPMIEVPSPEGSYPIALSYHAEIDPDQEASWVGLGWTLNAGAINRYVSMLPDDAANDINIVSDHVEGTMESFGTGVGVGAFHFGASISDDTYQGVGVGLNTSVIIPYTTAPGLGGGLGVHAGTDPYGGGYFSVGYSLGIPDGAVNASINIGYTLYSDADGDIRSGFTGNMGLSVGGLLGANISSDNRAGISYSVLGATSSFQNIGSSKFNASTGSMGIVIPIPADIPIWIDFSYSKTRYYMDNIDQHYAFGSLYFNEASKLYPLNAKGTFDVFKLKTTTSTYDDNVDDQNGGAFLAIDNYSVNAQGVGGTIQPCMFEYATLPGGVGQSERSLLYTANAQEYNSTGKMNFRFVNDFSNSFQWDLSSGSKDNEVNWDNYLATNARKVGASATKYTDVTSSNPIQGFEKNTNRLSSSNHIDYFTNYEIEQGLAAGLITSDNVSTGFQGLGYSLSMSKNIGAFKITNKSGVTYHFSLPAYNFEEYQKIIGSHGSIRTISKPIPYAYTWLLTAITGPDFVDRGVIGRVDENDYGYWVKFEYGKWTDQFSYRTPNSGTVNDGDGASFSYGKKQLYYLNSIKTRTHTALFVKELRKDGRSVTSRDWGGFDTQLDNLGHVIGDNVSVGTLKLSKVLLCENKALLKWLSTKMNYSSTSQLAAGGYNDDSYIKADIVQPISFQAWSNVLDLSDLGGLNLGKDVAYKQVVFDTDYSLCKQTPNSFNVNSNFTRNGNLDGKLSLKAVRVLGRNESVIVPPISFEYTSNNPDYNADKKDVWGNYKSDFVSTGGASDKLVKQVCTQTSANYVDAWSLNKINTAMGASIAITYESDQYYIPVGPACFNNFSIKKVARLNVGESTFKVYLHSSESLYNIPELSGVNVSAKLYYLYTSAVANSNDELVTLNKMVVISGKGTDSDGDYLLIDNFYDTEPQLHVVQYIGGNIILNSQDKVRYGGGLRVKAITLDDDEKTATTTYTYDKGYLCHDPININIGNQSNGSVDYFNQLKNQIFNTYYAPIIAAGPFLPSDRVVYSKVTIKDQVAEQKTGVNRKVYDGEGYTEFRFTTANDLPPINTIRTDEVLFGDNKKSLVQFNDFSNRVGLLKSTVRYRPDGTILSSNVNTYLHDLPNATDVLKNNFNSQGTMDQLFRESKKSGQRVTYTKIAQQPVVQIGVTSTDNQLGIVSNSQTVAFDFFSGEAIATHFVDARGNEFLSMKTPAYVTYPRMGLITSQGVGVNNKHMISQTANSVMYKVSLKPGFSPYNINSYNQLGLISASANVWNTAGVPTLKATYSWVGDDTEILNVDGTYPAIKFNQFTGVDQAQNGWQLNSRMLSYDNYSHLKSVEDVNSNQSVIFMDPELKFVTFSVTNASDQEVAYTGAEYTELINSANVVDGRVSFLRSDVAVLATGINTNTGKYALKVDGGAEGFSAEITTKPNRIYEAGVWVYMPGLSENILTNAKLLIYKKNGVNNYTLVKEINPTAAKKSGANYLIQGNFQAAGGDYRVVCKTDVSSSRSLFFDDFYVKPLTATISAYVYDGITGQLTHVLNNNLLYSRYEYDDTGRLTTKYKQILDTRREYKVAFNKINYGKGNQ